MKIGLNVEVYRLMMLFDVEIMIFLECGFFLCLKFYGIVVIKVMGKVGVIGMLLIFEINCFGK